MRVGAPVFTLSVVLSGCSGEDGGLGRTEPLTVDGAQFVRGALPGFQPEDSTTDASSAEAELARVTGVDTAGLTIAPGQSKRFGGRVSKPAVTVGLRFARLGAGYHRITVGARDLGSTADERTWSAVANFRSSIPPGLTDLAFVAFDAKGQAGPQTLLSVCILRPYPDNSNACLPTAIPPYLVLSLKWDAGVDLDLRVVTPSGRVIGAKAPSGSTPTSTSEAGASVSDGLLSRDSNASCSLDYLNREDVVWQSKPPRGTYQVYASLFDACGRGAARFAVDLNSRQEIENANYTVDERQIAVGEVIAAEARAGVGLGSFVTEFEVR